MLWGQLLKGILLAHYGQRNHRYLDFLKSDLPMAEYLELCRNQRVEEQNMEAEMQNIEGIDMVDIHELHMYNASGREINSIQHGEQVRLKVSYFVGDDTIQNPLLGVAIRRIDNEYICGINTKLDNVSIPWKKGRGRIDL